MHRLLQPGDLSPEFAVPEIGPAGRAYLDLIALLFRHAEEMSEDVGFRISPLDEAMRQYVSLQWFADRRGTRQQELVEVFHTPRRTVRDGLARLCSAQLVARSPQGVYCPTRRSGAWFLNRFEKNYRACERLTDSFTLYRTAVGVLRRKDD